MLDKYDVVETTVKIAGKKRPFVELHLKQAFNVHHEFRIVVNYEAFGQSWMSNPHEIITLVGEEVIISMVHTPSGTRNLFFGMVTNTIVSGKNGMKNNVVVIGKGRTVRLDGKKAMDSFMNKSLRGVVAEAVKSSGNGAEIEIDPTYQDKIDYICQYNESDFEFLNRLSYIYGEWFWDTGREIRFGRGKLSDGDTLRLIYDVNLIDFEFSSKLIPAHFNRYAYLVHDDREIKTLALDEVPNVGGYQKMVLKKSDEIYSYEGDLPVEAPIVNKLNLDAMVEMERNRAAAEMLTISGTSCTCEVQLGKVVHVLMPSSVPLCSLGKYRVVYIEHYVNEIGKYKNTFRGIVWDMLTVPMEPIEPPRTGPQQATVLSNADPENKGRVQVQFQWQKGLRKSTNWIRVQTPDAGSSSKVKSNRGFVCIPEEGDTVMVGFDYGDPNRPYVMGSLFSERTGTGGGQGNKGKSFVSRSGNALKLDDEKGSVTIYDKCGTCDCLEIDGNGNIIIKAMNSITLQCGSNLLSVNKKGEIEIKSSVSIKLLDTQYIVLDGNKSIKIGKGKTPDNLVVDTEDSEICIKSGNNRIEGGDNTIYGTNTITGGNTTIDKGKIKLN